MTPKVRSRLGRGLNSLISVSVEPSREESTDVPESPGIAPPPLATEGLGREIPVAEITANPNQPRRSFDDALIAHTWNGKALPKEHGGPARVILPKRYAWKGAKWVKEIVFLDRDLLGFWELRGYSNTADPWTEDRFS